MTAVVLAAGRGTRMHADVQKQYMELLGRPVITYTLDAFEKSSVDEVILVVGEGEIPFARKEIVKARGYQKVFGSSREEKNAMSPYTKGFAPRTPVRMPVFSFMTEPEPSLRRN